MEQAPGGCTEVQTAQKLNPSRVDQDMDAGLEDNILGRKNGVVQKRQHGYSRSTKESNVEGRYLTVVVQPQSKQVEGISFHVRKGKILQKLLVKVLVSQQP